MFFREEGEEVGCYGDFVPFVFLQGEVEAVFHEEEVVAVTTVGYEELAVCWVARFGRSYGEAGWR